MSDERTVQPASGSGHTLFLSIGGWTLTVTLLFAEIGLAAWIAVTIGPQSIALAVLLMIATAGIAIALCIWLVTALSRRLRRAEGEGRR